MSERDLAEVLDKVLLEIPETQTELRQWLEHIRGSSRYTPPENMGGQWRCAFNAICEHIGDPEEEWEFRACEVFSGRQRPEPLPPEALKRPFYAELPLGLMADQGPTVETIKIRVMSEPTRETFREAAATLRALADDFDKRAQRFP